MIRADIMIVGAGPAGAVAALNLAPTRRVVLVDRREHPASRIGEALPGAARRLLTDMGLLEAFLAHDHRPWYGNRSVWGLRVAAETDFLQDPDGHGWHLDRVRFDSWLRHTAVASGAMLLTPREFWTSNLVSTIGKSRSPRRKADSEWQRGLRSMLVAAERLSPVASPPAAE